MTRVVKTTLMQSHKPSRKAGREGMKDVSNQAA
jgi:hypothetical protein